MTVTQTWGEFIEYVTSFPEYKEITFTKDSFDFEHLKKYGSKRGDIMQYVVPLNESASMVLRANGDEYMAFWEKNRFGEEPSKSALSDASLIFGKLGALAMGMLQDEIGRWRR